MSDLTELDPKCYRLILDSLSEGVCTVDNNWNITTLNQAAQKIIGISIEKSLSLSFNDIFRCEIDDCELLLSEVMKTGVSIHDVNTHIIDQNGSHLPVSLNAAPLRNEEGEIEGLVAIFRDNRPLEILRNELRQKFTFGDIVTKNVKMLRILDILPDVADSDSNVLLLGPSGTGKELVARAIHSASPRKDKPFIAVNCGALPDNLLESELFGYKKGAFTDAKRDKPGRFGLAEGGTLFLDEIGDISPAMQVKLLRVLQERQYEPLGGTMTVKADVRIITATNKMLGELVEKDEFRSDLYYRINVIQFDIPPLSERQEDIPLLVEHFIENLNAEKGRVVKRVSPQAMERLMHYDYPGNIRELQNIIERAYILCRCDEIQEQCLPPNLLDAATAPRKLDVPTQFISLRALSPEDERNLIISTLHECNGNRKKSAGLLGINPSTLWRKMKKHKIL
ncbi:MAG: sigma 54-interacting transcriptional regulator [Sedimentisphaerales bacterium]|nr:sigma 54-interacting transcriptional regulator [Sedimentisphaerales bacterium]